MPLYEDDRILGKDTAPVTIIEYASLTCGHCAAFHRDTLPQVKAEWIDSGPARLVFRHYPLDHIALRAAAAATRVPAAAFFGFIDVPSKNHEKSASRHDPLPPVSKHAAPAVSDTTPP